MRDFDISRSVRKCTLCGLVSSQCHKKHLVRSYCARKCTLCGLVRSQCIRKRTLCGPISLIVSEIRFKSLIRSQCVQKSTLFYKNVQWIWWDHYPMPVFVMTVILCQYLCHDSDILFLAGGACQATGRDQEEGHSTCRGSRLGEQQHSGQGHGQGHRWTPLGMSWLR